MATRKSTSKYRRFKRELLSGVPELRCHYCHSLLHKELGDVVTLDHKTPIAKGGAMYDPQNVVISCLPCNHQKDTLDYEEFIKTRVG